MKKNLFIGLSLEFIKMVVLWIVLLLVCILLMYKIVLDPLVASSDAEKLYDSVSYNFDSRHLESSLQLETYEWLQVINDQSVIYSTKDMGKQSFSTEEWYHIIQDGYYELDNQRIEILHIWAKNTPPYYILLCAKGNDLTRDYILELEFPIESRHQVANSKLEAVEKAFNISLFLIPIILIIICAGFLSKKFKRAFDQLELGIQKVSAGEFDVQLEGKSYKEINSVFNSFNSLAGKLHNSELEKNEINQSKQQMLLDISHDLRTPSTTIQGYAKALKEDMVEDPVIQKKYLNYIYNKSKHVTDCINALFKYSQMENNIVDLNLIEVDIFQFLRETLIPYLEIIDGKHMTLDIIIPEEPYYLKIDEFEMKRALTNLLDNAIKYNSEDTCIVIESYVESGVMIRIKDDGIGISNHLKDIIFDPLVRGDNSRQSDGGIGIGLSITKKIIEHHHGSIHLEEVDQGTSFIIEL